MRQAVGSLKKAYVVTTNSSTSYIYITIGLNRFTGGWCRRPGDTAVDTAERWGPAGRQWGAGGPAAGQTGRPGCSPGTSAHHPPRVGVEFQIADSFNPDQEFLLLWQMKILAFPRLTGGK